MFVFFSLFFSALFQLSGVNEKGQIQFKSNFFGAFSFSELIVSPEPINFSDIFLKFEKYLKESPYVLAVICCLVFVSVTVIVLLRRLDKKDSALVRFV